MKKEKSRKLDQFYTKPEIAMFCINKSFNIIPCFYDSFIIEPSAWNGSFFNILLNKSDNVLGLDIDPKIWNIIAMDYLNFDINKYQSQIQNKKIITIWNPPFWKNSSLALKFINKSAEYSDYICFILPKTFKKDSMVNKINNNFHLLKEYEIPENSFIYNETEYNVPCIFQIWKKEDNKRSKIVKDIIHKDFLFVKKSENPDFAIRRVWVYAGKIFSDFENYSSASHYYIKVKDINTFIKKYNKIKWTTIYNTAWNPSLSKSELIEEYSKY